MWIKTPGKPLSPGTMLDLEKPNLFLQGQSLADLPASVTDRLYFHSGDIDGGNLGEPAPAMDHLESTLDGGQL